MLPAASGSRWMPRKMAGSAMMTMEPSSVAMNIAAVVLVRATHRYRSPGSRALPRAISRPVIGSSSAASWPSSSDALRQPLEQWRGRPQLGELGGREASRECLRQLLGPGTALVPEHLLPGAGDRQDDPDRKSTHLNSSHL